MIRRAVPFGVLVIALVGCGGPSRFPDDPEAMTLFSIDGTGQWGNGLWKGPTVGPPMYKCPVLGSVEVADPALRREVMAAVTGGIKKGATPAKCFFPRHIVRVRKGDRETDILICFECNNVEAHRAGEESAMWTGTTADDARMVLNKLLKDAGVPITPTMAEASRARDATGQGTAGPPSGAP